MLENEVCVYEEEKTLFRIKQENECFAARLWSESKPDTLLDIVVEQLLVNGNLICTDHLPQADFPWHEYSFDNFSALNDRLVNCLDDIAKCSSLEDAELLKHKHFVVYEAYLKNPIMVEPLSDGRYKLLRDGRHRVLLAKMKNNPIPVQVISTCAACDMTENFFKNHCDYGTWQFGTLKTTVL